METLRAADVAVLAVYVAGVVAFGCWFVRRSRTTEGFMAAHRSLPGWAVGLSIFGTYLSSNTFLGNPGKAYGANWNSFVLTISLPIAALIAVRFFVPFYRSSGEISAYHHLERRFGNWARSFAMVCYLLTQLARIGSIMLGVALGLNALLGWDMATIIVATGAVVTVYTILGGIEAVIWTDVAQSVVLTLGALLVTLVLVFGMDGGPGQIFATGVAHDKFHLGGLGLSLSDRTFWTVLAYGLVMNLNNFGIDQSFVQRYHTARSDREARQSVWLCASLYVPVSLVFFFIGTALFAYYEENPSLRDEVKARVAAERIEKEGIAPGQAEYTAALASTIDKLEPADIGDRILPHFIVNRLPPGLAGLLIAALFAAAMSSIDTSLNSSATIVLSDFYRRYLRPQASERESMTVLYVSTLAWGALGTGVAVSLVGVESVLDAWWILSGIFVGGMLGVFLLGLVSRVTGGRAAALSVVAGALLILWMSLSTLPWWPEGLPRSPFEELLIPVIGTSTIVLLGFLLGTMWKTWRRSPPA